MMGYSEQANLRAGRITRIVVLTAAMCTAAAAGAQTADLDALIKAAKAEGEVSLYSSATENVPRRVGAAFTAKYGIRFNFVRLSSSPLMQRYAAESQAGNVAADIAWIAGGVAPFAENAAKQGWIEPVSQAGLPVVKSGEFPGPFMRPNTSVVQIAPWGITYNTEKIKGADIPKDYRDIVAPRYKGQVLISDPRASDVYIGFWAMLLDAYGEGFFKQLLALEPRRYSSGVPAVQALGAGEGLVQFPAIGPQVDATKAKGAPIDLFIPAFTTGLEQEVVLTARSKSRHPAACSRTTSCPRRATRCSTPTLEESPSTTPPRCPRNTRRRRRARARRTRRCAAT